MNSNLIKEVMEMYNTYRTKWIKENGSDHGFNEWFTYQIKKGTL